MTGWSIGSPEGQGHCRSDEVAGQGLRASRVRVDIGRADPYLPNKDGLWSGIFLNDKELVPHPAPSVPQQYWSWPPPGPCPGPGWGCQAPHAAPATQPGQEEPHQTPHVWAPARALFTVPGFRGMSWPGQTGRCVGATPWIHTCRTGSCSGSKKPLTLPPPNQSEMLKIRPPRNQTSHCLEPRLRQSRQSDPSLHPGSACIHLQPYKLINLWPVNSKSRSWGRKQERGCREGLEPQIWLLFSQVGHAAKALEEMGTTRKRA